MAIILSKKFSIDGSPKEQFERIIHVIQSKKGKILSKTENNHINAKFGNMLFARLLGIGLLSAFKITLPGYFEFRIYKEREEFKIEITLRDNLGWLCYRDNWTKSAYAEFFNSLVGWVRQRNPTQI